MMITEKLIFSGVQFNRTRDYHTRDFDKTDIKTFMDRHLSRDLVQNRTKAIDHEETLSDDTERGGRRSRLQKLNPDTTKPSQRQKMTDTEKIN